MHYRIKKLIKENIIKKFQPNINPYTMNHSAYFFKIKLLNQLRIKELARFLGATKKINDIIESYEA
ncbi:MAG: hypothetical protein U9Q69_01125 [Nanoarchaeota archaeon]|nr:hypothetical protein [Nanoarchaeota archaeon]